MLMNTFSGKELLSFVRKKDYAHAGEDEAVELTMKKIVKNRFQNLLDVGCGRGGTAKYIQDNGWGKITGVDMDKKSIIYAQQTYPDVSFYISEVTQITKKITTKFDVFYLFNSFYEFCDQLTALKALRAIAKPKAKLVIFDYVDLTAGENKCILRNKYTKIYTPTLIPKQSYDFKEMAAKTSWAIQEIQYINDKYECWYAELLKRFQDRQEMLLEKFGEKAFDNAIQVYENIYGAIVNDFLGGCIIFAETQSY